MNAHYSSLAPLPLNVSRCSPGYCTYFCLSVHYPTATLCFPKCYRSYLMIVPRHPRAHAALPRFHILWKMFAKSTSSVWTCRQLCCVDFFNETVSIQGPGFRLLPHALMPKHPAPSSILLTCRQSKIFPENYPLAAPIHSLAIQRSACPAWHMPETSTGDILFTFTPVTG